MTPRASKDPNKIKYVERVNGRWVYRPYIRRADRRPGITVDKGGFLRPPIRLGSASDPWHVIVSAHAKAHEAIYRTEERDRLTLRWCAARYRESERFLALAKDSRTKAATFDKILDHPMTAGVEHLGDAYPWEITKPLVRQIRTKRLAALRKRGHEGTVHTNREIQHVSGILSWAAEHYDEVTTNAFKIKRLTETPRRRYVTHEEYFAQLALAAEVADYLPVVLELTYQLAARGIETLDLRVDDIDRVDRDGARMVRVRRRKGSETTYVRRNDRIDEAIAAAHALRRNRKVVGTYLIPGPRGPKLGRHTLNAAMQRLHRLVVERGLTSRHSSKDGRAEEETDLFWRLHDLKRKGISDAADNRIAGHKSDAIRAAYDVRARAFDAPE